MSHQKNVSWGLHRYCLKGIPVRYPLQTIPVITSIRIIIQHRPKSTSLNGPSYEIQVEFLNWSHTHTNYKTTNITHVTIKTLRHTQTMKIYNWIRLFFYLIFI